MGAWLSEGGTGTPHYVVNPDHVARLLSNGYQIIKREKDDDTNGRIAAIRATHKSGSRRMDTASG